MAPTSPPRLRLHTLGGPGVWLGTDPIPKTSSRRRLVAFLALVASHGINGITRDKVVAYLWPESDTPHARNSLKQVLFWLRRALRSPALIVANGDVLRLDPSLIQVDAWEFEAAIDRGDFQAAVALYGGPYLDGFHVSGLADFEEWSESERARLARRYAQALERLAQQAEEEGEADAAVAWWRLLADADPLSTSRALELMRAMIRAGDPTHALEYFHAHAALVRAELDCPPSNELAALAESLHGGTVKRTGEHPRRWSRAAHSIAYPAALGVQVSAPAFVPATAPLATRGRWWLAMALGALLLVAAGDRAVTSGRAAPGSAIPFTVLPFAVTGGAEFADLGVGLQDLIAARLEGVGDLQRVVATGGSPRGLLRPEARLNAIAGATVARRASARLYAMGQLIADSAGLQATATIYDRGNANAPVARAEARADLGSVFDLADALAAQLIAQMYVGPDQRLARVAATSTRSLPAFKAYLEGQRELRADSMAAAVEAFRRAVRADTTFSVAYYRLSLAADLAGQPDMAIWAAGLAARFSSGLTDYERELVQAYLVQRRGRLDEAERLYRRIVAEHPTDPEGWSRLAELMFHSNPLRGRTITEARVPLTRLLALTPADPEALIDLARVAALEGQEHEADTLVLRALAVTPDSALLDRAFRAFALGDGSDPAAARELLSRDGGVTPRTLLAAAVSWDDLAGTEYVARQLTVSGHSCEARSLGHRMLAQSAIARGRPKEALASLHEAESCGAEASLELRAANAGLPFLPLDTVEVTALREELAQDESLDPAARAYARGMLAVRVGDTVGAIRAMGALEGGQSDDSPAADATYYAGSLAARLALAQGRPRLALGRLERLRWEEGMAAPPAEVADRYLRAELLETLGREDEALGWFASIAQRSSGELVFLGPAELRQAEIYERRGDRADAARHYRRLLQVWDDPDPVLARGVEWARTRLASLGG
jgi:DNA-binding SARP family transcriptional activator/tetratricopeptide (TPR) repeat protein